jgi:hypothetical protein
VLLLFAFTPGIPEYLSGSTPVSLIVVNPIGFLFFLGLNLGLYGPGVLLLREAWVRWGRSWGALICFGAAYGLLEEGTALSTLFNPRASVVGNLGHYGRLVGVNWVWLVGVLGVHIVYSVGLPLVLLGLALPETRGRSLLTRREVGVAAGVYALDIALLAFITHYYTVELAWILAAAGAALLLWVLAHRLPTDFLNPSRERPSLGPLAFLLLGLAFFPALLLVPSLGEAAHLSAAVTGAVDLGLVGAIFWTVRQNLGRHGNESQLILLALGATLPLVLFGLLAQIALPVVLVLDAAYGLFFSTLWARHRPLPAPPAVPAGAAR